MLFRFACRVLVRLIIYENKLSYLLNPTNPQPFGYNHLKAINIDK